MARRLELWLSTLAILSWFALHLFSSASRRISRLWAEVLDSIEGVNK